MKLPQIIYNSISPQFADSLIGEILELDKVKKNRSYNPYKIRLKKDKKSRTSKFSPKLP